MDVLGTVFVIAALTGSLASMTAFVLPERRHGALIVATVGFAVAGLVGILSIGIFFLIAAMMSGTRIAQNYACLLYTSPSPRDATLSRMPSSA